ncbi:MAG: SpoIIE family protein phosphatase [Chlamydiales bacterium]
MIPFRKSIGFRLLAISFILLALPLLLDFSIIVARQYQRTLNNAKRHLVEVAYLRQLPLSDVQPLNKPLLEVMAYLLGLSQDFPEEPSEALSAKLGELVKIGDFKRASVLKVDSKKQYTVVGSSEPDLVGKDFQDVSEENNLFWGGDIEKDVSDYIYYDKHKLEPNITTVLRIENSEQVPIGILEVTDNVTEKIDALLAPVSHPYQINFALLLPSTIIFAATDPSFVFNYFLPPLKLTPMLPSKPIPVKETIGYPFFEFTWEGQQQLGYVNRLPGSNFTLLTYTSREEIFQEPLISFFHSNVIYIIILILGGILAYMLTRRMAKPIQNLSFVMQGIQEGKLNLRYKKDIVGYEFNTLGTIFNQMIGTVIEKKHIAEEERVEREKLASELKLGQKVQRSLLPVQMPSYPKVEISATCIPATEVGGDFYDVFVTKGQKLVLAIADAAGKGVGACFYSLSMRNLLRTFAKEYEEAGPAMKATNNLFLNETGESGMFITALMGLYDHKTQILSYCSYGHTPSFLRRENGNIEILHQPEISMGIEYKEESKVIKVKLNKGDMIILYTDGITEAHDESFNIFGEHRMMQCLKKGEGKSASEMAQFIVNEVKLFCGKAPQHDDSTLLIMKVMS